MADKTEVANYFIWRQNDATRNSISMAAQSCLSHKSLQGKSSKEMQEMMFQEKGINWNDYPAGFKRGRLIERVVVKKDVEYFDKKTQKTVIIKDVIRSSWETVEPLVFTQYPGDLLSKIPSIP